MSLPKIYENAIRLTEEGAYERVLPMWKNFATQLNDETSKLESFFVYYYLADSLGEVGQVEKALVTYNLALECLPEEEDEFRIQVKVEQNRLYFSINQYVAGEIIRKEIWSQLLEEGHFHEAYHLANDLWEYESLLSVDLISEVVDRALKVKAAPFLAYIYRDYANDLMAQRRYAAGADLNAKCLLLFEKEEEPSYQVLILLIHLNECEAFYQQNDYKNFLNQQQTLTKYEDTLVEEETFRMVIRVRLLFCKAVAALISKKFTDAKSFINQSLKIAKTDESFYLTNLQKCYQALTEFYYYDEAIEITKEAFHLAHEQDEYLEVDIGVDLGTIYHGNNQFQEAMNVLLPLETQMDSFPDSEIQLRYFSMLTRTAEQLPDGITFERARKKWELIGMELPLRLAFDFYFDYAQVLIGLNQIEKAFDLLNQAEHIAIAEKWFYQLPNITIEKAICESKLSKYEDALLRLLSMPIPAILHEKITYFNQLARVQTFLDKKEEALENYSKAIDLIVKGSALEQYLSEAYSNSGLIKHEQGDFEVAEDLYKKGLEIDLKQGLIQHQVTAYHNLGVLYRDKNDYTKAEPHLWTSLKKLSEIYGKSTSYKEQKHISDEWFSMIDLMIEVLLQRNADIDAFRLLIHKKSILKGIDKEKLSNLPLPNLSANQHLITFSGIRDLRLYVFHFQPSIQENQPRLEIHKIDLKKSDQPDLSPSLQKSFDSFRKRKIKQPGIRNKEYKTVYPWLVQYFQHLNVKLLRFQLPKFKAHRKELIEIFSQLLIDPLKHIPVNAQLIFYPEYTLGSFPFGQLYATKKRNQRLIEVYDISLFGGLGKRKEESSSANHLLLFGATNYKDDKLSNLPSGRQEIHSICSLFPNHTNLVDQSIGDLINVLNKEIIEQASSFIHFIGHADDRYPEAVILLPEIDQHIPVSKIRMLQLNGIHVVISACSSASGIAYAGWGTDSVAQAFLDAGAHHVISMLFPISDSLAPKLIALYYEFLKDGFSPSKSLSEVKRKYLAGEMGYEFHKEEIWSSLVCAEVLEGR